MTEATLRQAATRMRARALEATPGPWDEWHMADDGRAEVFVPNGTMDTETVLEFKDYSDCEECVRPTSADLVYITWMHPLVALAVADWLEATADRVGGKTWSGSRHALAVARAFLDGVA